jgi:tRNA pseudouridine55 synthase
MNGIINVYKPCGITSFDVVRNIKKLCKIKKVGHTGTLDPLASGVLPVCIGKGTKVVDYIMNDCKVYIAELKLGVVTDTYDREGKIIEENSVDTYEKEVISAINSFIGEIEQIPPMYSALKINGKKLYELARQGIEVERQARKINIYRINILSLKLPYAVIEIECSKGTYIRSLCYDIGRKLGCGAVMWNLERTSTGNFNKCEAVQLDKLTEDNIGDYIIPLEKIFREYEKIHLDSKFGKLALNGVCIKDKRLLSGLDYEVFYRVYIDDNKFIGLGKKSSKGFKIEKLLI